MAMFTRVVLTALALIGAAAAPALAQTTLTMSS